jgi:hypothetical protein
MRWAGHAARIVDEKYVKKNYWKTCKEKNLTQMGGKGEIVKLMLQKGDSRVRAGFICHEFQNQIRDYQLVKVWR